MEATRLQERDRQCALEAINLRLKRILPLLEKIAAKDKDEKPCVGIIGKGGSGHYVKMIHNGIEHGMMSAICESWGIMRKMGMEYEEIGDVLSQWNTPKNPEIYSMAALLIEPL